jgi:hypothetical protein
MYKLDFKNWDYRSVIHLQLSDDSIKSKEYKFGNKPLPNLLEYTVYSGSKLCDSIGTIEGMELISEKFKKILTDGMVTGLSFCEATITKKDGSLLSDKYYVVISDFEGPSMDFSRNRNVALSDNELNVDSDIFRPKNTSMKICNERVKGIIERSQINDKIYSIRSINEILI